MFKFLKPVKPTGFYPSRQNRFWKTVAEWSKDLWMPKFVTRFFERLSNSPSKKNIHKPGAYLKKLKTNQLPEYNHPLWVSPSFRGKSSFDKPVHMLEPALRNFTDFNLVRANSSKARLQYVQGSNKVSERIIDRSSGITYTVKDKLGNGHPDKGSFETYELEPMGRHHSSATPLVLKVPFSARGNYAGYRAANVSEYIRRSGFSNPLKHHGFVRINNKIGIIQERIPVTHDVIDNGTSEAVRQFHLSNPNSFKLRDQLVDRVNKETGVQLFDLGYVDSLHNLALPKVGATQIEDIRLFDFDRFGTTEEVGSTYRKKPTIPPGFLRPLGI